MINTVVIGAGQAGLATSRCLTERGIEHVVLERGRPGERWRTARWDSFRLLTPNWLSRLPGWAYDGPDPDGFMRSADLIGYLAAYARSFEAPVVDRTTVLDVRPAERGYRVRTDRGSWTAANVVIATGYHTRARVPGFAAGLPADLAQVTPAGYRGPAQIPDGPVLVVGASASGVQIADELVRAGRPVTLAVGTHTRLPRHYRGRDIFWWLERTGSLDRRLDDLPAAVRDRGEPSLQLSGGGRPVDLGALAATGVTLTGRLSSVDGGVLRFADDLADTTAAADARMRRVLSTVDAAVDAAVKASVDAAVDSTVDSGADSRVDRIAAAFVRPGPRTAPVNRFAAVVWATGFRPWYPWLRVPVLDPGGRVQHRGGVTAAPGLYAIGLPFQSRRASTFIDGVRHDATSLTDHIAARSTAATRRSR
jgi:putative flavoprotein involved in K+ transport